MPAAHAVCSQTWGYTEKEEIGPTPAALPTRSNQSAPMTLPKSHLSVICLLASTAVILPAQAQSPAAKSDKSAAYYHYSLGHLYAELAGAYANRSDYVTKAIENYRLAMKEDPG